MSHIHWVPRQNKLEIPRDKDEVNKREIHECDGRAHDPDTIVVPLTAKPTKDYKLKLWKLRASHTLGWQKGGDSYFLILLLFIINR
jgi:hypothetical protein